MHKTTRRISAVMVAAALSLGTLAPASAATIVGSVDGLDKASVSMAHPASLSIALNAPNPYDDEPQDEAPRGGVEGYTFEAKLVDVPLNTTEGWDQAQELSLADARRAPAHDTFTAVTNAEGVAVFNNIPVGLYFVTAEAPDNDDYSYQVPQDMLVTIPVGQLTEDSAMWQYDVAVNAKYAPDRPIIIPPDPITPIPGGSGGNDEGQAGGRPTPTESEGVAAKTPAPESDAAAQDSPGSDSDETVRAEGVLDKQLAETGASVIGMAVLAVILIVTGCVLLVRKRREEAVEV